MVQLQLCYLVNKVHTLFGKQGAWVVVLDFDQQAGDAKVQELHSSGIDETFFKEDVSNNEEVEITATQVLEKFGITLFIKRRVSLKVS
ncbi:hypothetical protein H7992_12990 [Sporosarcina sp. resist]|uniref:hypothetical protein n=1 Tax=Sporosarcina sp. resist TaxID=2762563 RepID=UPI00164DCD08|nr:hypothetical protein [Sporosarcina sp. resist]QNK86198.1 hypothetical protein H7992_12990 [Sporosarcina sp. resist]